MAASDNLYSRFVTWSKIILPLAALALLSTLFLFARDSGTDTSIPYAEIAEIAREPRISEPSFAGIADDGSVVSITATTISPDPNAPDSFSIVDLRVTMDATDGSQIDLTASQGRLDGKTQVALLTGLVRLTSSSGYAMESGSVSANLKAGSVESLGPLAVRAPYGELTAGSLLISAGPDGAGSQMVFHNGVRLLYQRQP